MRISRAEARKRNIQVPKTEKRSKYGAVKTTVDGVTFASKKEARRYGELRLLEKNGEITDLVLQPEFEFVVNGKRIGKYIADFGYYNLTGHQFIVEDVKGFRTREYRLKKKLVEALHGIEVQEV